MNTLKNGFFVGAMMAGLALASAVHANTIIGIDFSVGDPTNQSPGTAAVVGPYASAGWNNQIDPTGAAVFAGPITLTDSTSALTSAQFKFTQGGNTLSGHPIYNSAYGANGGANGALTPDQQLYNGTVAASPSRFSQEVVLTNIPYSSYSVYLLINAPRVATDTPNIVGSVENFDGGVVGGSGTTYYFQNSNQVNAHIPPTLGYSAATSTSLASPTNGANYVLFSELTNSSETFDLANLTPDNVSYANDITLGAIEIVDTSSPSIPEPATISLLGAVGAMLMLRRRRAVSE